MKKLTAYLMLIVILLLDAAMIAKSWYVIIPALLIQVYIAKREKSNLGYIMTFIIYLIVELGFALLFFGIYRLIKLIA